MTIAPVSRRSSTAAQVRGLDQGRNAQLNLKQVWPYIEQYAKKYGADPKVLAGIVAQESSFKNWGVHRDGTGHGLIGLDDNGLLPSFEKWAGRSFGRGANAATIPPEKQLEFLAKTIGELTKRHGSSFAAAREWHRGRGGMNDSLGFKYEGLIKGHINSLFKNGTPEGGPIPESPANGGGDGPRAPANGGGAAAGGDYTISRGDTLWGIASKLKAQGAQGSHWDIIRQIQSMNPKITNVNLIYAGDTIKLPGKLDGFSPGGGQPVDINGGGNTGGVDGPRNTGKASSAFEFAMQNLGENAATMKLGSDAVGRAMQDWVPNNVNCANFVSGCLIAAGQIKSSQGSAAVYGLMGNLDRDSNWKRTSLANAKPGDVVSMKTPGGQHVVMFAGWKNGKPQFIGSNNVNADGSQKVTITSMNYPIMAVHTYVG